MQVIESISDLRACVADWRKAGLCVGMVPTMGALHEGHLSLVRASQARVDRTIVTLFVNPTQFAPGEDLDRYPRPRERDLSLLRSLEVDAVFAPDTETMYPPGATTSVRPPRVATRLEGESRPHHFEGVCTVVLKLFNLGQPHVAFFGQKDFQQTVVIERMIEDLNVPVQIQVCPIVRDPDGLAMSSRNVYLSTEQRQSALGLYRALSAAAEAVRDGETDAHLLMTEMRQTLVDAGVDSIDYAVIADPRELTVLDRIDGPAIALVACRVGQTRLIDNMWLNEPE